MRRIKAVLRTFAGRGGVSPTAHYREAGVPKTTWLEWLNGTRELPPEQSAAVERYFRSKLRITHAWHDLLEIVHDDDDTKIAK